MEYCTNCGAEAPEDASFCSKCGSGIGHCKKGQMIKKGISAGAWECYRSSEHKMLKATMSGLVILMLGALILIAATGISSLITWSNFFACFLAGLGAIMVVNFLIHLLLPGGRLYRFSDLIGGVILLAIGALCVYGFGMYFLPIALVSIGIYIISMGVVKFLTRREPSV